MLSFKVQTLLAAEAPALDTRRLAGCLSLVFAVPGRRETGTREADTAIQVLHSRLCRSFRMTLVAPRFSAARLSWRGGSARYKENLHPGEGHVRFRT